MECPKCHHQQENGFSECQKCGIIFAKYRSSSTSSRLQASALVEQETESESWLAHSFYPPEHNTTSSVLARSVVLLGLLVWSYFFIRDPIQDSYAAESFMHLINLPFHEAGHLVFRPFGQFITSLGGTLGQLLMPLICLLYMRIKMHDNFSAAVCLWWLGQNCFDIAPYVNDARAGVMPLLGGNTGETSPYGFHDWEYLLTESGLLAHDHTIAKIFVATGLLFFVFSWVWAGVVLYRAWQEREG